MSENIVKYKVWIHLVIIYDNDETPAFDEKR